MPARVKGCEPIGQSASAKNGDGNGATKLSTAAGGDTNFKPAFGMTFPAP
jgi:hypothetical protein